MKFYSEHKRHIPEILGPDWYGRERILETPASFQAPFWIEFASPEPAEIDRIARRKAFPDYAKVIDFRDYKRKEPGFQSGVLSGHDDPDLFSAGVEISLTQFDLRNCIFVPTSAGFHIYGHWLLDILPACIGVNRALGRKVPVYLPSGYPEWAAVLLDLLGLDRVAELAPDKVVVVAGLPRQHDHLNVDLFSIYRAFLSTRLPNVAPSLEYSAVRGSRRVYLSRAKLQKTHRVMANEPEVRDFFGAAGFEIVYPEELTIRDQVALFQETAVLAGEAGSGMHNSIFCTGSATVINLQSSRQSHFIQSSLCHAFDQRCIFVFGQSRTLDWSSDFSVSLADCEAAISLL